jgi:Zn-dependent protease
MNRHTIPLGGILGIPIGLDYSWFLIFVLITWTMVVGYYPAEFKNWPTAQYWIVAAVTAIMLFVSVLLHRMQNYRQVWKRWTAMESTSFP